MNQDMLGGRFTFLSTTLTVHRVGYGAMQLAGPGVWRPPKDPNGTLAVLRAWTRYPPVGRCCSPHPGSITRLTSRSGPTPPSTRSRTTSGNS